MSASVGSPALWGGFAAVVALLLGVDIGVLGRRRAARPGRDAGLFTAAVVVLAAGFAALLWHLHGAEPALQFVTGFVVEEALSVDNLFVFLLIFRAFAVPQPLQHRVLFWGIFGALVMRAACIAAGSALVHSFHWLFYVFGAFLVFTGGKLLFTAGDADHGGGPDGPVLRLVRRLVPVTDGLRGGAFVVREGGRRMATPLLLVLLVVEGSDIVFAADSIPAIFAITTDPFLVYTSNVFAILGLRSLYFLLAGMLDRFRYLPYGLGVVLVLIGGKMLVGPWVEVSTPLSLAAIAAVLGTAVAASLVRPPPPAPP